jgi:hypothetical protein
MLMDTIFDLCTPRADVADGRVKDEEFAADLAQVVTGKAEPEYKKPAIFFAHTHPTRGLKALLESVCRRLSGTGGELNSVIRLDTQYGGGKTHSLIALYHAVKGMSGVAKPEEFVKPALLPKGKVRVAALDGENADPANGLELEPGLRAHSIWGEMAYRLAGRTGFERVRKSDEKHTAPGAETIAQLFGDEPALILIDEVSVYLRKVAHAFPDATGQFTAFLHALIKAVSTTPKAALVATLAVRTRDQEAADAYKAEHQSALIAFEEALSIGARKFLQIDPTAEDETTEVLRRRLFEKVDMAGAEATLNAYFALWDQNKGMLSSDAASPEVRDQFRRGYPFHPELMAVLVEKVSSLSTFQRTRGMLRLLTRTVHNLWNVRPADAFAIHPHHIDPAFEPIRDEITTRLERHAYGPVLATDVAAAAGKDPATAQLLDRGMYAGQPPVASYVARTIFLNTLAFPDDAQGIKPDRLRWSVCSPALEPTFVEAARKAFIADSLFLDDRPGAPMRFRVEANLNQIINRAMKEVDPDDLRNELNASIKLLFGGKDFELVPFPAAPADVPDEVGDGRPCLVVLHYDAFTVSAAPTELPHELARMATRKGVKEELRTFQNNLVFVVADDRMREDMKQAVRRRLGLQTIQASSRMQDLADYQQRKIKEEFEKSRFAVAQAVLQCFRHLFYPSHMPVGAGEAKLGHTALEIPNVSDSPGQGQVLIKRALRDQKKLLASGDQPDAPTFVRDQTPLKTKGQISTLELRNEFRKAPKLSMLLGDEPLVRCIQLGIEENTFIYRKGELVWGKGDPTPSIDISENAFVHTLPNAKELKLWPRKKAEPEPPPKPPTGSGPGPGPGPEQPPEPPKPTLSAEGPLKQALTELFERARKGSVDRLESLRIRLFEYKGAFSVYQAVATYPAAEAVCRFQAGITGEGITVFEVTFEGSVSKASAVKNFLDPQFRAAKEQTLEATYSLAFKTPLPTRAEKAGEFISAMTKYGGGEAYVEAQAAEAPKDGGEDA